ncbi:MAG: hypothetical protein KAS85_03460 [Rhodobacteraceae bacterium]|nr:hypothetical protein [Paracoccaceae bacterium]
MKVFADLPECLRREYFQKKENAPLLRGYQRKGGFSLYGHRLSSLYRTATICVGWLTKRVQTSFSFSKILKSNTNQKVTS